MENLNREFAAHLRARALVSAIALPFAWVAAFCERVIQDIDRNTAKILRAALEAGEIKDERAKRAAQILIGATPGATQDEVVMALLAATEQKQKTQEQRENLRAVIKRLEEEGVISRKRTIYTTQKGPS